MVDARDVARLVVHQANLVPQAVVEGRAPTRVLDDAAGGKVNLGKLDAGRHDLLGFLVGAANGLVNGPLVVGGLGGKEGARHVRAVPVLLAAHVKQHDVANGKRSVVGLVVRVCAVVAKAHDGREGVVAGAQASVLAQKAFCDLQLGHAGAQLSHQPLHGLVVGARGLAHEFLLARVFDRAGVVDCARGQLEAGGGPGLHQRHQPAGGKLFVHAQRGRVVADLCEKGHGILRVVKDAHVSAGIAGVGEQAVAE